MGMTKYVVEIEKPKEAKSGRPSVGPVYRNVLAKDGFRPLANGVDSCWDVFRLSVEKYPNNQMLGEREIIDGKAGKYVWLTYKEVYDTVLKVGDSICSRGINKEARCGIYGKNCTKWVVSMQACNAYGLHCVPLYDTLGAGAVKYIICHAEVSVIFAEEAKISEVLKTFPDTGKYLKTLVSFGTITNEQKLLAEEYGLEIYPWEEFLNLETSDSFDLPSKMRSDICTIMYTSGTTGEPKGVIITNESILSILSGVHHHLESMSEEFQVSDIFFSYLPLAHVFDRVIEELFISNGASIGI
nr:long chain acyl-CoA synthetase 4-like [Tanacetum cinerariifolium]